METIKFNRTSELKEFANLNRSKIREINDVQFSELYPILTVSNNHCMYYSAKEQENKFLNPPYIVKYEA